MGDVQSPTRSEMVSKPPPSEAQSSPNPQSSQSRDFNVLVTGFGPFKTYTINPSWLITSSLTSLPIQHNPPSPPTNINLQIHPRPIRVSYATVGATVPTLHAISNPRPDLTIHIGMAPGRNYYTVETLGHRDGYNHPDVDGQDGGANSSMWESWGAPSELGPGFASAVPESTKQSQAQAPSNPDPKLTRPHATSQPPLPPASVESTAKTTQLPPATPTGLFFTTPWTTLLHNWRVQVPDADIRLSSNAGFFLCDHIYYTSLAALWKEGRDRSVLFLHVPGDFSADGIEKGRRVLVGLIRVAVEVLMRGKEGFEGVDGNMEVEMESGGSGTGGAF